MFWCLLGGARRCRNKKARVTRRIIIGQFPTQSNPFGGLSYLFPLCTCRWRRSGEHGIENQFYSGIKWVKIRNNINFMRSALSFPSGF
jgi:hypothetical protein